MGVHEAGQHVHAFGVHLVCGALGPAAVVVTSRPGDVDGDGQVNWTDVTIVRAALNTAYGDPSFDARADLNGDDIVDILDQQIVMRYMEFGHEPWKPSGIIP